MEILELLDELEAMGDEGERWFCKVFPFLWGKTVVDAADFFDLIHQLRSSLPDELTTANQVARDREKIVREAHEERAKILEAAREQAQLHLQRLPGAMPSHADEPCAQPRRTRMPLGRAEAWVQGVIERSENYMTRTQGILDQAKKALGPSTQPGVRAEGRSAHDLE